MVVGFCLPLNVLICDAMQYHGTRKRSGRGLLPQGQIARPGTRPVCKEAGDRVRILRQSTEASIGITLFSTCACQFLAHSPLISKKRIEFCFKKLLFYLLLPIFQTNSSVRDYARGIPMKMLNFLSCSCKIFPCYSTEQFQVLKLFHY